MNKTLIRTISWICTNFGLMAVFIIGNIYAISSLVTLSTIVLWLTVLIAVVTYFSINSATLGEALLKQLATTPVVNRYIDGIFDIIMTGVLLYFMFPVLAIFYFIHFVLLQMIFTKISNYIKASTEK